MPQVSNGNRFSGTFTSARLTTSGQSENRRIKSSNAKNGRTQRDRNTSYISTVHVKKALPDVPVEKKWTLVPSFCCISGGVKEINVGSVNREKSASAKEEEMPNIKGRVNDFFHRQLSLVTPSHAVEPLAHPQISGRTSAKPRRSHSLREESSNKELAISEKVKKHDTTSVSKREKASSGSFISRYLNG